MANRQLGFRASPQEEELINSAARQEKRARNSFLLVAALDRAHSVLRPDAIPPPASTVSSEEDPLLAAIGTGRHIWQDEHADEYIDGLRSGWDAKADQARESFLNAEQKDRK
jgi:hypothetical protein